MTSQRDVEEELRVLERRWERITDRPEPPRTLLEIIEYSLGRQRKAEVYVNRLLKYFLDPGQPHGMGTEFLRAFLTGLPEGCRFEEETYDLSNVRVKDQVRTTSKSDETQGSATAPGLADLIIETPNEWFLLIELKFFAGENNVGSDGPSQTESYFQASHIGGRRKSEYETGNYYLYVHPQGEPRAVEEQFANWTWTALLEDVIEDFLAANAPRYPQRTVTQLHELIDDVQQITGMTDQQASERAKIELYLEHYDVITDITQTFDNRWETFSTEWGDQLQERLVADGIDTEDWIFRDHHPDWAHIFKENWWKELDGLENITDRADDRNDVRISLIHRLDRNRERAVKEQTLVIHFRNCGSNDKEFRAQFNDRLNARQDEIDRLLPDAAELTGKKRNLITATYDIRPDMHTDFFNAYIAALKQAFIDFAVENPELIDRLDEIYDEALEIYR